MCPAVDGGGGGVRFFSILKTKAQAIAYSGIARADWVATEEGETKLAPGWYFIDNIGE